MAPESRAQRSLHNNPLVNPTKKQDKLASPQGQAERSDTGSNKAFIPPKAPTLFLILLTENFFTKFMKAFVKSTQAWDREQAEPQEQLLKIKSLETYSKKSHMDCYHFCQQCEDYFEISSTIGINRTLFAALFFRSTISFR